MSDRTTHEIETLTIRIPIRLQRRGGRKLIMMPEGVAAPARKPSRDETLVKALVRAHRWRRRIESGEARSITDLAEQERVTVAYICRLLPLTCLLPDIWRRSSLRLAETPTQHTLVCQKQRAIVNSRAGREAESKQPVTAKENSVVS